jgi:diaminopimelate decarboxylase
VPLRERRGKLVSSDVVGPICESGDFFCKDRPLPPVEEGDYLALLSAGAYGFVMASNYNARPLPVEILVDGVKSAVIRRRQRVEEIWTGERIPGWLK